MVDDLELVGGFIGINIGAVFSFLDEEGAGGAPVLREGGIKGGGG